MSITDAQRRAHEKYFRKAWRQVKLAMPVEEAEALERFCALHGVSKAGFIRQAIKDAMMFTPPVGDMVDEPGPNESLE